MALQLHPFKQKMIINNVMFVTKPSISRS